MGESNSKPTAKALRFLLLFFLFVLFLVLVFAVGGFDFVAPKLLFTFAVFCFRCISKIQILRRNFITKLHSEIPYCTTKHLQLKMT